MATITEDFVSFETAKLLKEKGFNEPCRLYYDKYHGCVPIFVEDSKLTEYGYKELDCLWESDNLPTYEEACEAAIKYYLENLIYIGMATIKIGKVMKVMRCKKLGGREVPRSCHVLNGRKDYCENLFVTDENGVIKDNWL